MRPKEVIEQLKNLQQHCWDFADPEEPDNQWNQDVKALDYAINKLKNDLQYRIKIPTRIVDGDYQNGYSFEYVYMYESEVGKLRNTFTEEEIKAIDPRLWKFAEEVKC